MFVWNAAAFCVKVFAVMFVTPEEPILMRPAVIKLSAKVLLEIEMDLALFWIEIKLVNCTLSKSVRGFES